MTRNNDESGHVLTPTFEPRKEDAAFLNPNGEEVRVRQGRGRRSPDAISDIGKI